MDNNTLNVRKELLHNICSYCRYMEEQMSDSTEDVEIKYCEGFKYNHKSNYISMYYDYREKVTFIHINFRYPINLYFKDDKVFEARSHFGDSFAKSETLIDITDQFINGLTRTDSRDAAYLTESEWPTIKSRININKQWIDFAKEHKS